MAARQARAAVAPAPRLPAIAAAAASGGGRVPSRTVVIDNGGGTVRAGWGGDESPVPSAPTPGAGCGRATGVRGGDDRGAHFGVGWGARRRQGGRSPPAPRSHPHRHSHSHPRCRLHAGAVHAPHRARLPDRRVYRGRHLGAPVWCQDAGPRVWRPHRCRHHAAADRAALCAGSHRGSCLCLLLCLWWRGKDPRHTQSYCHTQTPQSRRKPPASWRLRRLGLARCPPCCQLQLRRRG